MKNAADGKVFCAAEIPGSNCPSRNFVTSNTNSSPAPSPLERPTLTSFVAAVVAAHPSHSPTHLVVDAQSDDEREEGARELGLDELSVAAAQRGLVQTLADDAARDLVQLRLEVRRPEWVRVHLRTSLNT